MIRFSASLVVVAVGLLVAGVVTSDLKLVYAAIGVSGVALVALGVSVLAKRRELFGQPGSTQPSVVPRPAEPVRPEAAGARTQPAPPAAQAPPWEAVVTASSSWPVAAAQPGETMAHATGAAPWGSAVKPPGDRPPDHRRPADVKRPPAAYASGPPAAATAPNPAPAAWEWRGDAPATQPLPRAVSVPAPASSADPPTMTFPVPETLEPPATADAAPANVDPAEASEAAGVQEAPETPVAAEVLETPEVADAPQEPEAAEDQPSPQAQDAADEQASAQPTRQLPIPAAPEPAAVDLEREVTVVPGVPRYHNAQCLLIRFMDEGDLDKMTLAAAQEAGCTPCRACLPE